MIRYQNDTLLVFAGLGFSEAGPFLMINDVENRSQERFFPCSKTFSLKMLPARFCIGPFDLTTHETEACKMAVELPHDSKDLMCPVCRNATGFNPAFYNTPSISPQQRGYNNTPHYAYLAYFSPAHIKAGISAESRGIDRLLEQGARAALVVGRFPTAEYARDLEARMCLDPEIYEIMRSSKKAELLVGTRYNFAEAQDVLLATADRLSLRPSEDCLDLDDRYFVGPTPSPDDFQIPSDGSDDVCAGRCVGMVGSLIVFEQGGINYVVSLREWESHAIELYEDEVIHTYSFEPMQMSLL